MENNIYNIKLAVKTEKLNTASLEDEKVQNLDSNRLTRKLKANLIHKYGNNITMNEAWQMLKIILLELVKKQLAKIRKPHQWIIKYGSLKKLKK